MNRAMTLFRKASTALLPVLVLAAGSCGLDDSTADDPAASPPAVAPAGDPGAASALGAVALDPSSRSNPERRGIGAMSLALSPRVVPPTIDPRRSLAVTDQAITSTFTLQ